MLIIEDLRLGYQHVPKVATTSMFHWMYRLIHDAHVATGAPSVVVKRRFFTEGPSVQNAETAVAPYKDYFRFALTRDPIKRFLSMYSNRVVHHRELSARSRAAERLEQAALLLLSGFLFCLHCW